MIDEDEAYAVQLAEREACIRVSPAIAMLMAKAWQNGLTYGICKALAIYDDLHSRHS